MIAALLVATILSVSGEAPPAGTTGPGAAWGAACGPSEPSVSDPRAPFQSDDLLCTSPQVGEDSPSSFALAVSERWVSVAGLFVDTSYSASGYEGDQSGAFGMSFGAWWWQPSNLGGAVEASFFYDPHQASTNGVEGDVDTWDLMLGARFGIRTDSGRFVLYGKGGGLYRTDEGNGTSTRSSGNWGGYMGAGLEVRIGEKFALAPEAIWTFANVAGGSKQFVASLNFVVRF